MSAQDPQIGEFFQAIIKGPIERDDVMASYFAATRLRKLAPADSEEADRDMDIVLRVLDAVLICVPLAQDLLPPDLRAP